MAIIDISSAGYSVTCISHRDAPKAAFVDVPQRKKEKISNANHNFF